MVGHQQVLLSGPDDEPLLKAKASHEIAWINKVDDHTQGHTALIAWRPDEVRGEVLGKL